MNIPLLSKGRAEIAIEYFCWILHHCLRFCHLLLAIALYYHGDGFGRGGSIVPDFFNVFCISFGLLAVDSPLILCFPIINHLHCFNS